MRLRENLLWQLSILLCISTRMKFQKSWRFIPQSHHKRAARWNFLIWCSQRINCNIAVDIGIFQNPQTLITHGTWFGSQASIGIASLVVQPVCCSLPIWVILNEPYCDLFVIDYRNIVCPVSMHGQRPDRRTMRNAQQSSPICVFYPFYYFCRIIPSLSLQTTDHLASDSSTHARSRQMQAVQFQDSKWHVFLFSLLRMSVVLLFVVDF